MWEPRFHKSRFANEDSMNRLSVVSGLFASLLLGAAATVVAQDEHRDKQDNARPENRQEQARPQEQTRPDERRNEPPQSGNRREMTPQNEGRPEQQPQSGDRHPERQQDERQMQQPERRQNMGEQQEREKDRHGQERQQPMQNGQQARAPHRENRRRIPEQDFHAYFGQEHRFAPGRVQVVQGRPQFAYSGYMFEIVEVWPAGWAYDADDYYIDYFDDEYWLCSFSHSDIRLELIIIG